ncbi:MAG TPA: ABC transporter ATP-binding protein [Mycobacteriales bacterium]|nr:ABC transporter ATP-binding protein [Mycobacteriales bacterium]
MTPSRTNGEAVISTEALTKRYGDVLAVDRLDLVVREGDRYGFLGPNGSGKTTTVRMLLGLVFATSGRIEVLGHEVPRRADAVLHEVGSLVEGPAFYNHISGRANLLLFDAAGAGGSRRTRRSRVGESLERVGLVGAAHRRVGTYSLGMRQRLGIAAALLRRPRLLVLDEPTNGLDPAGIREVRDLLVEINDDGTTVFLSSHLLAEVEQLCTRAGIVHAGQLIADQSVADLLAPTGLVRVTSPDLHSATRADGGAGWLDPVSADAHGATLRLGSLTVDDLVRRLVGAGIRVDEVVVDRPTLEEVYLELTGGASEAGVDQRRVG